MTTPPALETALDAAAHRHYSRRRRLPWRRVVLAPVLALGCAALVVAVLPTRAAAPTQDPPAVTVPGSTLALSRALTFAPARRGFQPGDVPIPHAALAAVAGEFERTTPYPPGVHDSFDWQATPADPHDMASLNFREEVRSLVQYRAACLWLRFWLSVSDSGNAPAQAAAAAVLADVPAWPAMRGEPADDAPSHWRALADAATWREPAPLRADIAMNCRGVGAP